MSSPGRRATRLASRQRLLDAAFAELAETGIRLGVRHLKLEDVIERSGVSRSTAYRVWRTREEFYDDVLASIAQLSTDVGAQQETWDVAAKAIERAQNDLGSVEGRRRIMLEAIRQGAAFNFGSVTATREWRNWISVAVGLSGLPDESRASVTAALREEELGRMRNMADFVKRVATVLGLRMRPEFGDDYGLLVMVVGSYIDGLGIARSVISDHADRTIDFGAGAGAGVGAGEGAADGDGVEVGLAVSGDAIVRGGQTGEWSVAAIGYAALFDRFMEIDPDWKGPRRR